MNDSIQARRAVLLLFVFLDLLLLEASQVRKLPLRQSLCHSRFHQNLSYFGKAVHLKLANFTVAKRLICA